MPPCLPVPGCRVKANRADASVRARLPQFESRITSHESRPSRPSLVRGDSPRNAPLCMPPCVRVPSWRVSNRGQCHRACPSPAAVSKPTVPTPACVRGSRSSNHESRVTNHESRPSRPSLVRGDSPRNAPLCMPPCVGVPSWCVRDRETMPPCLRVPGCRVKANRADASVRARLPQFESRITSHDSRPSRPAGSFGLFAFGWRIC